MDTIQEEKLCVGIDGLCGAMSIGKTAAYNLVNSKSFYPAFKLNGKWLVSIEKLRKWISEQSRDGGDDAL